jgi:histidinol dehydrogenase
MKLIRTFGRTAKPAAALIAQIEARGAVSIAKVEPVVTKILNDIRKNGDAALTTYANRFDSLEGKPLRVTVEEMQSAWNSISPTLQQAMKIAHANIRAFAEAQKPEEWTLSQDGLTTGQIVRPLASVACYVPGGRYPYPSTVLMTTTPARVAGVQRIVVCSPKPAPETLAAAHLAGLHSSNPVEFYRIGGAQAIAALAYGTESIPRVEKIVGPGNLYVTVAKQMISPECGIDMPAGPTEIGVLSETGDPAGIAADLIAQAEHDPESLAVLITPNETLASAVLAEVKLQSKSNTIAKQSLAANGVIFVTKSVTEARDLTNRLAFEHLSVDSMSDLAWITTAASVFVGRFSPQSMGDYLSGPNHVLPTGRAGRIRGGLSVTDFLKIITVQQYTRKALAQLGPHAIALAEAEGLTAHAQSIRVKLRKPSAGKGITK